MRSSSSSSIKAAHGSSCRARIRTAKSARRITPEATKVAQAFVKAAPERLVWGSDWPHPTEPDNKKPDDAVLLDLMIVWAPNEATRNRILVTNPEALYGFPKTA
jgi:predicted TIM-barrel fold metal-dependent hydrolase